MSEKSRVNFGPKLDQQIKPEGVEIFCQDSPAQSQYALHVAWTLVKQEYDEVIDRLRREQKVPGFRQGKATERGILAHFGVKKVWDAVQGNLNNLAVSKWLEGHRDPNEKTLGPPGFKHEEFKEGQPHTFTVTWFLQPQAPNVGPSIPDPMKQMGVPGMPNPMQGFGPGMQPPKIPGGGAMPKLPGIDDVDDM